MFEEEFQAQKKKIVNLQEQLSAMERQQQALGSKLGSSESAVRSLEGKLVTKQSELEQALRSLQEARRVQERYANMEHDLSVAQSLNRDQKQIIEDLDGAVKSSSARVQVLNIDLGNAKQEVARLKEKVGPLETLIGALGDRKNSDLTVIAQLEKLGL